MANHTYVKLRCSQCGETDFITPGQKTHKCSHCGYRNKVTEELVSPASAKEIDDYEKSISCVAVTCPYCSTLNAVYGRAREATCHGCGKSFSVIYNDEPAAQQTQPQGQGGSLPSEGRQVSKKNLILVCVAAVIFFLAGILLCSDPGTSNDSATTNRYRSAVIVGVKSYLRETLKDPSSYQEMEWSQIGENPNGQLYVRHKYRAKNGLGGYVVEEKIFYLDKEGNVIWAKDY